MKILKNISLQPFNTFGINAKTQFYVEATNIAELQSILKLSELKNSHLLVIGGGSNILLTKDFDGFVIKNNILGKTIIEETSDYVVVKIGGGENWHGFVEYAIANNWGGVENLSLIPGTVGAAPMQNIGAYGVEIKEVFESLEAVEIATGKLKTFNSKDCQFGYRESIFKKEAKDKYIITGVLLKLKKHSHQLNTSYGAIKDTLMEQGISNPTIKDVSKAVISIRQSKLPDPKVIGNAGSFFKNPTIDKIDFEGLRLEYSDLPGYVVSPTEVKIPAAWLIEQCGWKGERRGNIGVHTKQALVLVNYGGGDGSEIKKLSEDIQSSVAEKFGIVLSAEVNFV
ncbi:MAG TPA: UDP-N-acetylmuramate dehydrogenase [Fulvivirga sp.]|nr:UDP-N-acetylmuramate dehydrogenase [Fulvivirga sp.]